jgi:phosphoesterase RecJ-like protein
MTDSRAETLAHIRTTILRGQRFLISSHARPDGDSIGSQLAMAYALKSLGKSVRIVNRDPAPPPIQPFPGVDTIEIAEAVEGDFDAAIVLECSHPSRTGVSGLERYEIINIDHHPGNTMFGAINWFDEDAAACGEMVFDVIEALGVPLTPEIATHVYVAILTDTGGFHYSHISPRTFEICRRTTEAGARPQEVARLVYDSSTLGRLRLMGAVLSHLEFEAAGRLALVQISQPMLRETGGSLEDSEGLINLALTVKEIEAVAFFKQAEADAYRVSMRSKGDVDVGAVAKHFGGGGHKNAAGCTLQGRYDDIRTLIVEQVRHVLEARVRQEIG